jgi:hypothetical protein
MNARLPGAPKQKTPPLSGRVFQGLSAKIVFWKLAGSSTANCQCRQCISSYNRSDYQYLDPQIFHFRSPFWGFGFNNTVFFYLYLIAMPGPNPGLDKIIK